MIQISNQHLIVTMTQEGGTLTSIRDAKTGREYLWQGDPAYWTGQAPNLFPFVGRLYEKTYTLRGKAYPMTIHGFVRHAQMAVEEEQEASCCFLLTDSPELFTPTALPSASGMLWRGPCCRWPSKWKTGLRSHCTAVWAVIPVLTSPWRRG